MVGDPHAVAAVQIALALAIGLLIGFEREWSNKDAGIRTCALTALAGALAARAGAGITVVAFIGIVVLVTFINLRALRGSQALEITTSAALLLVYVLGTLVGHGDYFAPVAAAIVATLLLAWKVELHRFAGELQPVEIRGAIWLGLIAFVVYPLLPNRTVDPWGLVNPHGIWVAVIVVAAVGFGNYVLMRKFSARGLYYSAVLGGLVSSTATILELGTTLRAWGEEVLPVSLIVTLLATLAMFGRNLLLLALFAPQGVATAAAPMVAMTALAAILVWTRRNGGAQGVNNLKLDSPISLRRLFEFGIIFLVIAAATTLAQRHWGHSGAFVVAALGGIFNSAGATAAVGELAAHGTLSPAIAGIATVIASMTSALANAPLMNRVLRQSRLGWTNEFLAWGLVGAGAAALVAQHLLV